MSDLDALEPWLGGLLAHIEPPRRAQLARRLGQFLRRENYKRVVANLEPDGTPMAPRQPRTKQEQRDQQSARHKRRGGAKRRKGAMFQRIELARNMQVTTTDDEVRVSFGGRVAHTAAVHHFGLEDAVDHRIRNSIRVRYKARRLLGFGPGDREAMREAIMEWLEGR